MASEKPYTNKTKVIEAPEVSISQAVDLQVWDHPDSNWNKAAQLSPQPDPFCARTEWQFSFHEAMEPDRKLIIKEVPGSLVAFAEMPGEARLKTYVPLESGWCFGSPLLGPEAVDLLSELMEEFEPPAGEMAPAFFISGLSPQGRLRREVIRKLGSRCEIRQGQPETLCNASLEGGVDGYLSRRSAKHRRNMGKQSRRAARAGVTFERHIPDSPAVAAEIYARMLAVEETSWKGIGECGMTVGRSRKYYDVMMRRLSASGGGRIMFARHDERDIGYIFGGLAGHVYRGQQFSFSDDWKSYSIGNLLQMEQIKWLCEEGISRYDMGPMMDYKVHWTENSYAIVPLMLRLRPKKDNRQYEMPV